MDMVERVARAMLAIVKPSHHSSDIRHVDIDDSDIDFAELARAAIEAMREPTDEMCAAMARYYDDNYRKGHEREDTPADFIWQDMIDAALKKA